MALQLLSQFKKYKHTIYKYYSIAESYFENGRNKKDILVRFGKLDDEHARRIKAALKVSHDPMRAVYSLRDLTLHKTLNYLDVAVVYEVLKEAGIDSLLESTKALVDINRILSLLVIQRICNPGSKLSGYRWIRETALGELMSLENREIEPQYLYRALPEIAKHKEKIEDHLYRSVMKEGNGCTEVYYDLTTSYFCGTEVSMAAYSKHSKDHRPDNVQLVLGLLINQQGFPFSWDIYPGNKGESKTMIDQVNKLKNRFKLTRTLLVFDRGFLSQTNLKEITQGGYHYLTGLDSPQVETLIDTTVGGFLEGLDEDTVEQKMRESTEWEAYDENKYYVSEVYTKQYHGHTTVISFDVDQFKRSRMLRAEKIDRFKTWVDNHNRWLAEFKKDASYTAIEKDVETELKRLGLKKHIIYELREYKNEKRMKQRRNSTHPSEGYYRKVKTYRVVFRHKNVEKLDGLFGLIASPKAKLTVKEMIYHYREKHRIEAAFRTMKSLLKLRPWYVYKEAHVEAHYTICVLAYFIEKIIDMKLEKNGLKNEGYTVERLLEELGNIKLGILHLGKEKKVALETMPKELERTLRLLSLQKLLKPASFLKLI